MGHAHIPAISPLTPKEAAHTKASPGKKPCHVLLPHIILLHCQLDLQAKTMAESILLNKAQPGAGWHPSFNLDLVLFMVRM